MSLSRLIERVSSIIHRPPGGSSRTSASLLASTRESSAGVDHLDEASAAFAVRLHRRLRVVGDNLCASPFSIRAVLALVLAGARGGTARELAELLAVGDQDAALALLQAETGESLQSDALRVAAAAWIDRSVRLLPDFEASIQPLLVGGFQVVDFGSGRAVGATINEWVRERTAGRIDSIVDAVPADTRLMLVNAVTFAAKWESPLTVDEMRPRPFSSEDGRTSPLPFMSAEPHAPYARTARYEAVDLAYRDLPYSLLLVLPPADGSLSAFEDTLTAAVLADIVRHLEVQRVQVLLPRFTIESTVIELPAVCAAEGCRSAFDRSAANLSGINGLTPPAAEALFVNEVRHRARIEVDETGTTATAATVAVIQEAASPRHVPPPPPRFVADRPFLFVLRNRVTGSIIFMGRVADPTPSS